MKANGDEKQVFVPGIGFRRLLGEQSDRGLWVFVNFRAGEMDGDYYAARLRADNLLPVGMALTVCK